MLQSQVTWFENRLYILVVVAVAYDCPVKTRSPTWYQDLYQVQLGDPAVGLPSSSISLAFAVALA